MKYCILLCLIGLFTLTSCSEKQEYFNGEIIIIDTNDINNKPDTLLGEIIKLDGLYTTGMWVYDTLIGFISSKFSNYFMNVFNVNSGKFLYSLCKRGQGPDDFISITWTAQFVHEDHIYLWIRKEGGKDESVLINLENPDNVVRQKMNIKIDTEFQYPFGLIFVLNDSLFLGSNQGEDQYLGKGSFVPPAYHIYNSNTKQEIKHHRPYNAFTPKYNAYMAADYYYSMDRMKPDKSKIVMAMSLLDQINIFDMTTGEFKGYRNKNSPDFKYLTHSPDNFIMYYIYVCVDDTYIYGLYSNTKYNLQKYESNIVNVFDWNGNFIKQIILDKVALDMAFDPVNKYLYTDVIGEKEEEIYRYDLSYLYE
jgi:hypothetical protein